MTPFLLEIGISFHASATDVASTAFPLNDSGGAVGTVDKYIDYNLKGHLLMIAASWVL